MKKITVPTNEQVAPEARAIFDSLTKMTGKVPNLYATIGYSANALNSYLAYAQAQARGNFHARDREAIYLIVSQLNGCPYCLASHTQSAIKSGWTEADTLLLRAGDYPDPKWKMLHAFISSVIAHKGHVDDLVLDRFFASGYTESALIDLMALISVMSFTNYVYRLTEVPIDFPLSKDI
jgi:AhpD family alkylhydroperoxidase